MIVTVSVTKEHIKRATKNAWSCPIARAVNDHLVDGYEAAVSDNISIYNQRDRCYSTTNPSTGKVFMMQYDTNKAVGPIEFDIDIPQEYLNNG